MAIRGIFTVLLTALVPWLTASATPKSSTVGGIAQQPKITVLYDAFGRVPKLRKDLGYSALVEVAGKRILFDTGDNPDILEANAKALGVDLSRLDFVVISHRHGDHMGGMEYIQSASAADDVTKEGGGCLTAARARSASYYQFVLDIGDTWC